MSSAPQSVVSLCKFLSLRGLQLMIAAVLWAVSVNGGFAQDVDALQPGEAFLTRFSGAVDDGGTMVIDVNGIVGGIIDVRQPGVAPQGQEWADVPHRLAITAADIGQVFGVALDGESEPSVYLAATSAFGLHRTADNSAWMPGQWGPDAGPGTVWRLNAANGYQPEVFVEIALDGRINTGAGLGNIAFDRWNSQLFVSDLESGMIHRLGVTESTDLGHYDHGAEGRLNFTDATTGTAETLAPIAFDPTSRARIDDCVTGNFAQTPACWNFADFRRRVWGLDVRRDPATQEVRLYYAIWGSQGFDNPDWAAAGDEQRNSVWSIRIAEDGGFDTGDVRREFFLPDFFTDPADIARAGPSHPVADISFPQCAEQNIMLVAERGGVRNLGLDAEEPFAYPNEARVIRYELDENGVWQPASRYDVGNLERAGPPQIRSNSSGGVAFGLGYTEDWTADFAQPDQFVWMSGDDLCSPESPCFDALSGEYTNTNQVHGVQGTPIDQTTDIAPPEPVPAEGPDSSYMIDADVVADPARNDATKIGDVAIFQPCGRGDVPGGWLPPDWWTPPDGWVPPDWWPPEDCPFDLGIEKTGPAECVPGEDCVFTITITNTRTEPYIGSLYLTDVPPPGALLISPPPPAEWNCGQFGGPGGLIACASDPTVIPSLGPGESVTFPLVLRMPADMEPGEYANCVNIAWPTGPNPGIPLLPGGAWDVAWVEAELAAQGFLAWGEVDGIYIPGDPLDPTQAAIDAYLGTPAGTGTLEGIQDVLFPDSAGLGEDCDPGNDEDCAVFIVPEDDIPDGDIPDDQDEDVPEVRDDQPDLAVVKELQNCTALDEFVMSECTFRVEVTNESDIPFTGTLELLDEMPEGAAGLELLGQSPELAAMVCETAGLAFACTAEEVTIAPGATVWIEFRMQVPATADGDQNCIRLGPGHEGDPNGNKRRLRRCGDPGSRPGRSRGSQDAPRMWSAG